MATRTRCCVALGIWAAMAVPGVAAGEEQELYGCDHGLRGEPTGHVEKRTDPPAGSAVRPGQEIVVEVTWRTDSWPQGELHKVLDCVTVGGELDDERSGGEKPAANDGRFTHRYTIPTDAAPGTEVCDRAMVSGPDGAGGFDQRKSEVLCLTVGEEERRPASTDASPGDDGAPPVEPDAAPDAAPEPAPDAAPEPAPDVTGPPADEIPTEVIGDVRAAPVPPDRGVDVAPLTLPRTGFESGGGQLLGVAGIALGALGRGVSRPGGRRRPGRR